MVKRTCAREEYFKILNLHHDPFQDDYSEKTYFITPELQHRLDLIKHLLEFSQQILLVKGVPKVGKTAFCKHLMTAADAEWLFCKIDASEEIGPDTLVKVILQENQDFTKETVETIAALNKYLEFCNQNTKIPILLIDNAERLNQETLHFIFKLLKFKENETFIRVVLIGQEYFLQKLNELVKDKERDSLIHTVTIPVFTLEQTPAYLQHRLKMCGAMEKLFSEKQASRIHKVAAGVAGDINFLARQGLSDPAFLPVRKQETTQTGAYKTKARQTRKVFFTAAMVISLSVAFWMIEGNEAHLKNRAIPVSLPPAPAAHKMEAETNTPVPTSPEVSWEAVKSLSIPEESINQGSLVGTAVIRNNIGQEGEKRKYESARMSPSRSTESVSVTQTPPLSKGEDTSVLRKIKGREWLLAQSANQYVLQLIGAMDIMTITRFLQEVNLDEGKLALYQARQAGRDWHVLVYGPYRNRQQAKAAIAGLPAKVRAEAPWPKPMQSIQMALKAQ